MKPIININKKKNIINILKIFNLKNIIIQGNKKVNSKSKIINKIPTR